MDLLPNVTNLFNETADLKYGVGSYKDYSEYWVAVDLNKYYLKILSGFGVVLNLAVFITILFIKPFTTSSLYVACLAIVDTLALVMKLTYLELTRVISLGDVGCKFMHFIAYFSVHYANWIVVIMTIERFIAVWFPLKVSTICTKKKAKITLMLTAAILVGFNLHFFWTYEEYEQSGRCRPKTEYIEFITKVWPWMDACIFGLVPCFLLIIPNALIIYNVRRAIILQRSLTQRGGQSSSRNFHQTQLTVMLVSVAVAFVCCVLPFSIFFIIKPYWNYRASGRGTAQYYLVLQLTLFLADCNHAVNFFFFFLGGKRFRAKFVDIVCCRSSLRARETRSMSQTTIKTSSTSLNSLSSTFQRSNGMTNG